MRANEKELKRKVADAILAMNRMLPRLSSYASTLSGKPVRVVVGEQTKTDGRTIWIRPPLSLADAGDDVRDLCGLRTEDGRLECPACASREQTMVALRHEIGHIIHNSFELIPSDSMRDALDDAGFDVSDMKTPNALTSDVIHLASQTGNKALTLLSQVTDDVRVDQLNCASSAAFRQVYQDERRWDLEFGLDDSLPPAIEADEHVQIMLGLLSAPMGVDVHGVLCDRALEIVTDSEVTRLLADVGDVARVPTVTVDLYRRLIDLGVYTGDEFEDQPQQDEDADSGDTQGTGGGGPATDEQINAAMEAVTAMVGHEPGGHAPDGEAETALDGVALNTALEDAIETVLSQIAETGGPQMEVGAVRVHREDEGHLRAGGSRARRDTVPESLLGSLVAQARSTFQENRRVKYHRNVTRGRVAPSVLGKRAWNEQDKRLFAQRHVPDKRSYSVLVGMDNSGSTSGSRSRDLRKASLAIAQMCNRVGVEVGLYAHTSEYDDVAIYEMKAPTAPWKPEVERQLWSLGIGESNADGTILTVYRRQLQRSAATHKILLYFTDGVIPGYGGNDQEQTMRDEVEECRRAGITLLGVGVGTNSPEAFGIETVRLDGDQDLKNVLAILAEKIGV